MQTKIGCRTLIASLALALLAGCASTEKPPIQFWPPSPDPPRIQYLKKITDSADVEETKSWSLLDLGKDEARIIPILKPYGIAVRHGIIYLCDTMQAQVVILDLPGKKVTTLSGNKGPGKLMKPVNVAVDDGGSVYVADTGRKAVLKYAPNGDFQKAIGDDLSMKPVAVATDELYLYVLDQDNGLVRLFDPSSGAPVRSFGQEGNDERGHLFMPLAIGLDGKGGVYVTNLNGRIINFDRDGHPIRAFGQLGTAISEYNRPRAISFDKEGIMYIVDAASQNVRLLNGDFRLLMSFGEPGTPGSLNVPAGIAISTDNLAYYQKLAQPDFIIDRVLFVVSQFGDDKISIYGLGKKKGIDYDALLKERLDEIKKKEESIKKDQEEQEKREKERKEKASKEGEQPASTTSTAPASAPATKQ